MQHTIDPYEPQAMTLEEFQTLSALLVRLVPQRSGSLTAPLAPFFDAALHDSKREAWKIGELLPDVAFIRAGLRLVNDDALRLHNHSFTALAEGVQEALLARIETEADAHWPQLPAGRWCQEMRFIMSEIFMMDAEARIPLSYGPAIGAPAAGNASRMR